MAKQHLPAKNKFCGLSIDEYMLDDEVGRGKNGVVYAATKDIAGSKIKSAIKIIPEKNLKPGWEDEIKKLLSLDGIPQAVRFRGSGTQSLKGNQYAYINCEFVNGDNLKVYAEKNPSRINMPFIDNLLLSLLDLFYSMNHVCISHGDLHAGNILIAIDERQYDKSPIIKVTDFGIGGSQNDLHPKDDNKQIADIIHFLLENYVDQANLGDKHDRELRKYLISEFLPKYLLEENPTAGEFVVKSPEKLIGMYKSKKNDIYKRELLEQKVKLKNPFEYLSCEQIGDSFELLQTLYSKNFPGYDDLLQNSNAIFTGPRGCGKTTIFKNLSLKTKLLGNTDSSEVIGDFIGIYYHCSDLYFPFHYYRENLNKKEKTILLHYFNLAILRELLDTIIVANSHSSEAILPNDLNNVETYIQQWIPTYQKPPKGTDILRYLLSFVDQEKNNIGLSLRQSKLSSKLNLLNIDFIPKFCDLLQQSLPWFKNKFVYIFLDDYSMPHISEHMQIVLNDLIFYRWPKCYFKVSTESIASFNPYDTSRKLLEEAREYDLIDLGEYFIHKGTKKGNDEINPSKIRKDFLVEVINNRLKFSEGIHKKYKSIKTVLGPNPFNSYNELARVIRGEEKTKKVYYAGLDTITDLFSGDIADILRLVQSIFLKSGSYEKFSKPDIELPISNANQDHAIRDYGSSFLNKIEAAPKTGSKLKEIAENFGKVANWTLRNRTSQNVNQNPPWQAFRLEIKDSFSFDKKNSLIFDVYNNLIKREEQSKYTFDHFVNEIESTYKDLLKYGVFLRDMRGKSQRGAVVPRLYLRRLLIPSFLLTPSQRDNIGLEAREFLTFLHSPSLLPKIVENKVSANSEGQNLLFR